MYIYIYRISSRRACQTRRWRMQTVPWAVARVPKASRSSTYPKTSKSTPYFHIHTHMCYSIYLPAWQKPPAHQHPQSVGIQPPTAMYASTHVCYSSTHPKRSNSTPYCYTYTHVCVMVLLLRGMRSARNSTPYFHIYTLPCTHCHVHTRVCDGAVAAHNAQC